MKDKMVYLISGTIGEYSDREDWPVATFTVKDKAELFHQLLKADPRKYDQKNSHRFSGLYYKDEVEYYIDEVPINPEIKD